MYLGVDLGTSSIKIILADKTANIIDYEITKYSIEYPKPGWSQQNPDDWWNGFITSVKALSSRVDLKQIKTICFSGQMHGLVILDKDDKVIRPAILWNDGRTVEECEYLNNIITKEKLIDLTGNTALTGFTAPKILWLKKHEPENFSKINKIMLPKDYLQYKLTQVFASDVSDNSGTLYFDVENKCWSKEMLDILGITTDVLPNIYESSDVISKISPSIANELGLSEQTKVVIGGGDQAMGAIGTGTINDGQVSISLGTSGVIFVNSNQYVKDKDSSLHMFCHANGNYHFMGVTLSCTGSTKWWVEDILHETDYAKLFDGLSKLDIDPKLTFLPYLIGERSPINDPLATSTIYGINITHDQKDITKAILEGICMSLRDCLEVVRSKGINPSFARVIGGGAKSHDWIQMLSDILNIEIRTISTNEGGGLGAVILGLVADKVYDSVSDACNNIIKEVDYYYPRKENIELYNEKFKLYKKLYKTTNSLS